MTRTGDVRVGTSGWRYPPWRGEYFPIGLPQRLELDYLSRRTNAVEINATFYSLQRPDSFRRWYGQTPDDFVFAVKGPRFVTHMKKLNDVATPVANFFASGVLALADKLGPILWQLPPTLGLDAERLATFFTLLPRTTTEAARLASRHDERLDERDFTTTDAERPIRHALEVRHHSFVTPELAPLLRDHDIATVVADTAGKWPKLGEPTSDLVYVRLHGDAELYTSGYSDVALDEWAMTITGWARDGRDVEVHFDNDVKVHAPFDAEGLLARLRRNGLALSPPTPPPAPSPR